MRKFHFRAWFGKINIYRKGCGIFMKKRFMIVVSSTIFLILILFFIINVNDFNQEQRKIREDFFVFSEAYTDDLTLRLDENGISYKINQNGQLMIQRKYEEKAVACCT